MFYIPSKLRSVPALILVVSTILSIRLILFIKTNAVNLLFSDHWAYLKPLFDNSGAWARFTFQHGPHRQGLGFVISGWLMEISNWNTNLDSYFIGAILCLSNLCILFFIKTLRGKFVVWDLICPLLILSPLHYETILLAPNSSHSIVPLFLIILSCFGLLIKNKLVSNLYLTLCGSLLLYTGFGFFAGLLVFTFLILKSFRNLMRKESPMLDLSVIFLCIMVLFLYFSTYNIHHGTYDFSIKFPAQYQYLEFICYLWAGVFQIRPPYALYTGLIIIVTILACTILLLRRIRTINTSKDTIALYLIISSLVYSISVTIGRIDTGSNFAQGSRYMTLAIPAILGAYIYLDSLKINYLRTITLGILTLACLNDVGLDKTHTEVLEGFQGMKRKFLLSYSPTRSLAQTEMDSGVLLLGATEERFQFLQKHKLHFPK